MERRRFAAEFKREAVRLAGQEGVSRAKFFQQYRLFFRFHQASRIIVYAWVNDADTRRGQP